MTTLDNAAGTCAVPRQAVAVRLMNGLVRFLRAWKNRRAFYRLGEMSDAELADIGLTRTDLSVVTMTSPFGADPTVRLGAIAQYRIDQMERIEHPARRVG